MVFERIRSLIPGRGKPLAERFNFNVSARRLGAPLSINMNGERLEATKSILHQLKSSNPKELNLGLFFLEPDVKGGIFDRIFGVKCLQIKLQAEKGAPIDFFSDPHVAGRIKDKINVDFSGKATIDPHTAGMIYEVLKVAEEKIQNSLSNQDPKERWSLKLTFEGKNVFPALYYLFNSERVRNMFDMEHAQFWLVDGRAGCKSSHNIQESPASPAELKQMSDMAKQFLKPGGMFGRLNFPDGLPFGIQRIELVVDHKNRKSLEAHYMAAQDDYTEKPSPVLGKITPKKMWKPR